ncbi:MAG: dephospho-CoA kinase [Candidatus Kapaibacteriales bacterium]
MDKEQVKIVAITGNIGSGKSAVAKLIANQGYFVISSDETAKELINSDVSLQEKLKRTFGDDLFDSEGKQDKGRFREILFGKGGKSNRVKMDSIIHPAVLADNFERIEKYIETEDGRDIVFVESALAFESGMAEGCDYVVQVSCPPEIADKRLTDGRGLGIETIEAIRATQLSEQEKEKLADFTINNSSTLEALEKSVGFILPILESLPVKFGREEEEEEDKLLD